MIDYVSKEHVDPSSEDCRYSGNKVDGGCDGGDDGGDRAFCDEGHLDDQKTNMLHPLNQSFSSWEWNTKQDWWVWCWVKTALLHSCL